MFKKPVKEELKKDEQWKPLFPVPKKKSENIEKQEKNNNSFDTFHSKKEIKNSKENTFSSLFNNQYKDSDSDHNEYEDNISGQELSETLPEQTQKPIEEEHIIINESVLSEIESLKQEAYEKGYAEGVEKGNKDGMETGLRNAKNIVERIETTAIHIEDAWENIIKKYEKQILNLICRVAEKVVSGKVELDKEEVKKSILYAFELVPEPDDVIINVNPDDYEYIEAIKEDFFDEVHKLKTVSIISNPSINQGGCKIITKSGEINSNIDSRLDAVRQSIINSFEQK